MYVLRIKLDNGADFLATGLVTHSEGYVTLNPKGQPLNFIFFNEIVSIEKETIDG